MGLGHRRAVGHARHLRHNGVTHRLSAEADGGLMHRDGEQEAGGVLAAGVGIAVGHRPGIGDRRRDARRCPRQCARVGVQRQTVGQAAGQGIAQGAVPAGGGRQRQRRNGAS